MRNVARSTLKNVQHTGPSQILGNVVCHFRGCCDAGRGGGGTAWLKVAIIVDDDG